MSKIFIALTSTIILLGGIGVAFGQNQDKALAACNQYVGKTKVTCQQQIINKQMQTAMKQQQQDFQKAFKEVTDTGDFFTQQAGQEGVFKRPQQRQQTAPPATTKQQPLFQQPTTQQQQLQQKKTTPTKTIPKYY